MLLHAFLSFQTQCVLWPRCCSQAQTWSWWVCAQNSFKLATYPEWSQFVYRSVFIGWIRIDSLFFSFVFRYLFFCLSIWSWSIIQDMRAKMTWLVNITHNKRNTLLEEVECLFSFVFFCFKKIIIFYSFFNSLCRRSFQSRWRANE